MLLAIDIGNTNIVIGVLDDDKMVASARFATNVKETEEEYSMKLHYFLTMQNALEIDGAIISSVVPALVRTFKKAIKKVTGVEALVVGPGIKTGLKICIDDPATLGADLVVGAVAAANKYPKPTIIFDLGTATTGFVLNSKGEMIGGMIAAGIISSINALSAGTAQLPQINISAPAKAIGTNTIDCMRSGSVLGATLMLDGFVDRFEEELGEKATVVVTGGLGKSICKSCRHEMIYDENLLIDGLKIIYDKNK